MKTECPNCAQSIEADDTMAGTTVLCPTCNQEFVLPKLDKSWTVLRILFVASLGLQILSLFLPAYRDEDYGTFTNFGLLQRLFAGAPPIGVIFVIFWLLVPVLLLLYSASPNPQRLAFILGAVASMISPLLFISGPHRLIATVVFKYAACALALVGFFIKPPKNASGV